MVTESTRLSAQDWARAALKAIAAGGVVAVAVEPLARTLGVTKGSFYAHYRNRDELIAAALVEWVRGHGDEGLAGVRERRDGVDGEIGVGREQPQQFTTRVARGAGYGNG